MPEIISNSLAGHTPQVLQEFTESVSSTNGPNDQDSLSVKSKTHMDTPEDIKSTSRNQTFLSNIGKHFQSLRKTLMSVVDVFARCGNWFANLFKKDEGAVSTKSPSPDGSVSNNLPKNPSLNNVYIPDDVRQSDIEEEFIKSNESIKTRVNEAKIELQNNQRQEHIRNSCKALNQISQSFSEDINKVDNMISKLENGMNGIVDDGAVQLFGEMDISQRDSLDIDHEDERLSQHRSKTEEDFTDHASQRHNLGIQRHAIEKRQETFENMKQQAFDKVKRNSSERLDQTFKV